ncbi:hypothetical protein SLEP1_g50454 [Rubroshorea leprosula]|uniref:Uncharacterized protein n=1 Tax=Rubroshorea leprosula TaxID=152421 RepID=A0AAV5M2L0_9ROSI|nr:hypothetical protein SLEP1_g50454 [Rubroshorea leprosula]
MVGDLSDSIVIDSVTRAIIQMEVDLTVSGFLSSSASIRCFTSCEEDILPFPIEIPSILSSKDGRFGLPLGSAKVFCDSDKASLKLERILKRKAIEGSSVVASRWHEHLATLSQFAKIEKATSKSKGYVPQEMCCSCEDV